MSAVKWESVEAFSSDLDSAQPVLAVFSASWCGTCRAMYPVIEGLANDNSLATVGIVDTQQLPNLSDEYNISSLPTLILIKDRVGVERWTGYTHRKKLQDAIDKHLTLYAEEDRPDGQS